MKPHCYSASTTIVATLLIALACASPARADDCGPPSSASSCVCIAPRFEAVAIGTVQFTDSGAAAVRLKDVLLSGTGSGFSIGALIEPDIWNEPIRRLGQTVLLTDFLPDTQAGTRNRLGTIVPQTGELTELLPTSRSCKTKFEMRQLAEFLARTTNCDPQFYPEFNIDPRSACDTSSCSGAHGASLPMLGAVFAVLTSRRRRFLLSKLRLWGTRG